MNNRGPIIQPPRKHRSETDVILLDFSQRLLFKIVLLFLGADHYTESKPFSSTAFNSLLAAVFRVAPILPPPQTSAQQSWACHSHCKNIQSGSSYEWTTFQTLLDDLQKHLFFSPTRTINACFWWWLKDLILNFSHTTLHASENFGMFWSPEIRGNLATEI